MDQYNIEDDPEFQKIAEVAQERALRISSLES